MKISVCISALSNRHVSVSTDSKNPGETNSQMDMPHPYIIPELSSDPIPHSVNNSPFEEMVYLVYAFPKLRSLISI
jgi:hypothetical protein